MKESVRKVLERLRRKRSVDVPTSPPAGDISEPPPTHGTTGLTVFDDIALRLRNLTVEQLDVEDGDPGQLPGAFKIRLAQSRPLSSDARTLVDRGYARRGYRTAGPARGDPNLYTFVAYDEGKLTGTVSIRIDSPERGLTADDLYREELDELRKAGCKICEFTKLALDVKVVSKPVLAGLFHTAYLFAARLRDCSFAVIEVNPRHVAFYSHALRFEPIGPERMNRRVDAPAILLCVAFDTIAEGLAKFATKTPPVAARNLFVHGFMKDEEAGVLERLRELDELHR
jgi:N-acyl amino acid synthase FeeM